LLGGAQESLQRSLGCRLLESGIDGIFCCTGLLDFDGEDGIRHIGGGNSDRAPVDLSLGLGNNERGRFRGSCSRRDQGERGGSGASQVLVRQIEYLLVVGVAVDGRHRGG